MSDSYITKVKLYLGRRNLVTQNYKLRIDIYNTATYNTLPNYGLSMGESDWVYKNDIPLVNDNDIISDTRYITGMDWVEFNFSTPVKLDNTDGFYGIRLAADTTLSSFAAADVLIFSSDSFIKATDGTEIDAEYGFISNQYSWNGNKDIAYQVIRDIGDENGAYNNTSYAWDGGYNNTFWPFNYRYTNRGAGVRTYLKAHQVDKAYSPTPENASKVEFNNIELSWRAPVIQNEVFENVKTYYRVYGDTSWVLLKTAYSISDTEAMLLKEDTETEISYEWKVDYKFEGLDTVEGDTWIFEVSTLELTGTSHGQSSGQLIFDKDLSNINGGYGSGGGAGISPSGATTGQSVGRGTLAFVVPPSDINVDKTLYAISNNEFWYESADGVMSELAAANGDINVNNPISTVSAYQKVFIANKDNLKVADFVNTRLTSDIAITTNIPSNGDILSQVTTSADMVVDFIYYDTSTSKHYVYGRKISTQDFNTSNNIEDADGNVIITSSNLSAVDSHPLWYDWEEYNTGQVSTYNGMPSKAQLCCLYRGRLVLAGNPEDPYQWYMSRQANPWDWKYDSTDVQAAVAGGNGDMGKAGDVIKALIPFHDDYLILGCSRSILVMRGDPAFGGSLDLLDSSVGIYGSKSWCFDNEGNLYFYGTNGIYLAPRDIFINGRGGIKNISKTALPNI